LAFDHLKDHPGGGWLFGDDDWRLRRLVIDVPPDGRRRVLFERNRHGLVCGFYSDVSRRGYTPYREALSEFNLQHVAPNPGDAKDWLATLREKPFILRFFFASFGSVNS
jgi:hypothetical protein